uniref:CRIB domain-containing protein n=2 Tax=Onchocerca TaxID=6281 RepID=A0A8R1XRR9_ONCVO
MKFFLFSVKVMIRRSPRFWFLNCCISPQSEIARIRIDRSMIGGPTDFRHIGHMGANDLNTTFNVDAVSCLLRSKGDDSYSLPVPQHLRANDVPIKAQ